MQEDLHQAVCQYSCAFYRLVSSLTNLFVTFISTSLSFQKGKSEHTLGVILCTESPTQTILPQLQCSKFASSNGKNWGFILVQVSISFFNVTPGANWKSANSASLASLSAPVGRGMYGDWYFLSSLVTKNH